MFKSKIRDEHSPWRSMSYLLMEIFLGICLLLGLPWSSYALAGLLTDNLSLRILGTIIALAVGIWLLPFLGLVLMPAFLLLASPIDLVFRRNTNSSPTAQVAVAGIVLVLYVLGRFKFGSWWVSLVFLVTALAIANLFIIFPLALIKKARKFMGTFIHESSWPLGVAMWIAAALDCYRIWGFKGIAAGILLGGVGLLPVGVAACAVEKSWKEGLFLILSIIFTLGFRVIGARIAESSRAVLVAQT